MVRRRLLSSSAKQASMSAYQNFCHQQQPQQQQQQQQRPQSPLAASLPQYWQSMCHKLGGAAPVGVGPPRRQQPREAEQQHLPLQRDYQTMWGRCCGQQGPLLKPGVVMPAFPHLGYRQVAPTRGVTTLQPQRPFQYQQGSYLSYPAAVQMHKMWHQQQPHGLVPVGILKKASQLESSGVHHAKRVTIKAPASFQAPKVEPLKPRPEVPRRTGKRMRQSLLRREQQKVLQHQMLYQKQLQKQLQAQKELRKHQRQQRKLLKKRQEQQHREELEQVQQKMLQHRLKQQQLRETNGQQRQTKRLLKRSNYFNFGKIASSFLENTDSEVSRSQKPQNFGRNQNFSYQGTKKCPDRTKLQEKPEVPRKRVKANREGMTYSARFKDPLDLENESSTITLTTEQSQADCRTPYRSGTSLVDRATNTQSASMSELLKQVPPKATSDTGKGGARKLNINELLRSEQVKGLNADPMCQSLMELVTLMCASQEEPESRLTAGSGGDDGNLQKKYSVYLMVTSDEDEDVGEQLPRSKVNGTRITGDSERIQGDNEEFSQRCGQAYQDEYPRLGRRKRTRRRWSSRLDDLDCLSSGPLPLLPMRRPLHWPKPDYSKLSQGRSNQSRTQFRVRSHSSSKQIPQMRSPRSVCSVLDPKRSWKLWEDLPMTAKTLNKAYSRLWSKSGGQSCTTF